MSLVVKNQDYCLIGKGIFVSPTSSCYSSVDYDLANCCFSCFISNASGNFQKCGSLYEYGGASCNSQSVVATVTQLCGGTAFSCGCNMGNNLSQFQLASVPSFKPTTAPVSNAPILPIKASTNSGNNGLSVNIVFMLIFCVMTMIVFV